jgi:hypothetical protein
MMIAPLAVGSRDDPGTIRLAVTLLLRNRWR